MPRNRESALQTKIFQAVFGLGLLGIVVFATKNMMFGSTLITKFLAAGIVGASVVFALDKRYWLLSAFLFGFYDPIPYIKFTGAELGALVLISVFFVRAALRRDHGVGGAKPLVLAAIPFLFWMCLVWSMNPTGMFIFGSASIGGRFYFKVLLAFFSMICLSSLSFDEDDARMFLLTFIFGYVAFVVKQLLIGGAEDAIEGSGTHYTFTHLSFVVPFFLCRYTVPELFERIKPFFLTALCYLLCLYSGNRTTAARPVLVGLIAPIFLKKDQMKTMMLVFLFSIVIGIAVVGHGTAWNLPFSVQRSLSFLPGKWDARLEEYGFNDSFRSALRTMARERIAIDPWFGDKGFTLNYEAVSWGVSRRYGEGIELHALTRNWHNVWLGMSADFGIPLSICWGVFMAVFMFGNFKRAWNLPARSWKQTLFLYAYILGLVDFLNSFFAGGHSALTAQQYFLWSGMMMAAWNGVQDATKHQLCQFTKPIPGF